MDIISYVTPERTIDDEPVTYLSEQISDYGFPLRLIFRRYTIQAPDAINSRLSINHIFIIL